MYRKVLVFTTLIFVLAFASCNKKEEGGVKDKTQESVAEKDSSAMENKELENKDSENMSEEENATAESEMDEVQENVSEQEEKSLTLSNMADDSSEEEVRDALIQVIKRENVDEFLSLVSDYNETIEEVSLNDGFQKQSLPVYDLGKIGELWATKKSDFPGTNCRINTFMLLKDELEIGEGEYDDSGLFIDNDAITLGKLFDEKEHKDFKRLFSRVKTEATKDVEIHAKKMKEHFSEITFSKEAAMVSVVLHDDLDGDYLFIGHSGVMVPIKDGYLFIEKLSFDEPYQAIKFREKTEVYSYLTEKYKNYQDETTAKPFVMENGELVKK